MKARLTALADLCWRPNLAGVCCQRMEADPSRQRLCMRLGSEACLPSLSQTIRLGVLRPVTDIQRRARPTLILRGPCPSPSLWSLEQWRT